MLSRIFSSFDANKKEIDKLKKIVEKINNLAPDSKKLKGQAYSQKTEEFRQRFKNGETIEDLMPEVFAAGREASLEATVGLRRPYDTQLIAGVALALGKIAEQKTGEGKTLTAVLPLYLHSLTGKAVHLVTVNDFLARLGAGWNGPTFSLLGISVGVIVQEGKSYLFDPSFTDDSHFDERLTHLRPVSRKEAYVADVVYGTNNEFGFDYLRDNMVSEPDEMVQRGHYYAIVDEVDSVLIDEARTPLIISAPDMEPTDKYYKFAEIIGKLASETDYVIDEKLKTANLTEHGIAKVEKILGIENLYEKDFDVIHHIENALRARTLFLIDRDYVVQDNKIIIVDEFTGRLMFGRRWSDGLHQAVEAKEGVQIEQETKTLATISFQNYFRMYERLAGMTGTAATESEEFHKIYGLDVIAVPTYRPVARTDYSDVIYKNARSKYTAISEEIDKLRKVGRPILVGTTSIEKNEIIDNLLKRKKIPHNVLNAKNHEREAEIIAQAGLPGAVTIATNMAGRGVDIILGGARPDALPGMTPDEYKKTKEFKAWEERNRKVISAGGLHVIGTERHESRRIDNQLRGRSGRLGDAGSSRFYLSLEDDLMRIFGGERISSIMTSLQIPENQPIENPLISRAIQQAQVKVETFNFDARKRVVEYDDVANQQREIIYKLRKQILESENIHELVVEKTKKQVELLIAIVYSNEAVNYEQLVSMFVEIVPLDDSSQKSLHKQVESIGNQEEITKLLLHLLEETFATREKQIGKKWMQRIEKYTYRSSLDELWIEHLTNLDDLREGVGLRAYGHKDPLVEFKNEAFDLFDRLIKDMEANLARRVFRTLPRASENSPINLEAAQTNVDTKDQTGLTVVKKIGRNDPCWCGSGKKWKKCHYPQFPLDSRL